jgi:subtilase family serine protease
MNASWRAVVIGATAALGVGGTLAMSAPLGARPVPRAAAVRILADRPPPVPRGAVRLGPLAPASRLRLEVTLKVRDPAALTAFLAALSDRRSPQFHHFLRPGQFGPRFGPALSSVAAVRAALRQAGLPAGVVTANRLAIPVTATAAAAERAFGTELSRYRLPGGRIGYQNAAAPRIAAGAARYVSGVLGLSTLYRESGLLARRPVRPTGARGPAPRLSAVADSKGPRACSAATASGAFTASDLASHYLMSPMYGLGDLGAGVRIAVFEQEPDRASDITAYKTCYKVKTSVSYIKVDGGAGSGAGSGEAALDIEDSLGLAPHADLDVYQGPNTDTGTYDLYNAIISADKDEVITTSWGLCELDSSSTLITDEQTLFEQANAQDQTVVAAAGDAGSTDCLGDGTGRGSVLAVDDPGSQPYVDSVGGTSIGSAETVWNDSSIANGAGGGGLSADWCMPGYQYETAIPGLISSDSKTNSGCPASHGQYLRQVPDVSALADPQSGYAVYYKGKWQVFGGTSAAAPLWAAVSALIDASPFCSDYASGHPGALPEGLYDVASTEHSYIYSGSEVFRDVTQGNNDYTPSGYHGALYPATTGYDMASGLGTPLVTGVSSGKADMFLPGLAAMMCRFYATQNTSTAVTGVSPPTGSTAGGTTVTVTGSGFLPIKGADKAEVGSTVVAASCSTSTTCTLVTPPEPAGTVDIRISAEDFGYSPVTSADHFTYVSS